MFVYVILYIFQYTTNFGAVEGAWVLLLLKLV